MSTAIKICGLSTVPTLAAALDAGADMVGFVFFEKSPRCVGSAQARDLAARVEEAELRAGRGGGDALAPLADRLEGVRRMRLPG